MNGGQMRKWFRQFFCGLTGHNTMLRYEDERLALWCTDCGHESPGWEVPNQFKKRAA